MAAIRPILSAHFKPALLARMTVVPFYTLSAPALREVAKRLEKAGFRAELALDGVLAQKR